MEKKYPDNSYIDERRVERRVELMAKEKAWVTESGWTVGSKRKKKSKKKGRKPPWLVPVGGVTAGTYGLKDDRKCDYCPLKFRTLGWYAKHLEKKHAVNAETPRHHLHHYNFPGPEGEGVCRCGKMNPEHPTLVNLYMDEYYLPVLKCSNPDHKHKAKKTWWNKYCWTCGNPPAHISAVGSCACCGEDGPCFACDRCGFEEDRICSICGNASRKGKPFGDDGALRYHKNRVHFKTTKNAKKGEDRVFVPCTKDPFPRRLAETQCPKCGGPMSEAPGIEIWCQRCDPTLKLITKKDVQETMAAIVEDHATLKERGQDRDLAFYIKERLVNLKSNLEALKVEIRILEDILSKDKKVNED